MMFALLGATALGMQHKEAVATLLGMPREAVVTYLLSSAVRTVSAALFLIYYGELSWRSKNLLVRKHWRDLGGPLYAGSPTALSRTAITLSSTAIKLSESYCFSCAGLWATKLGFIVLSAHLLAYRCQQECDPKLFHSFEQHFYRVQWYIRLFAAAAATSSIAMAALLGTWNLLLRDTHDAAQHPSKMLGAIPNSIVEAAGLKEGLHQLNGSTAAALVGWINGVVCPAILVYVLWALWLPQLPLLQHFYFASLRTTQQSRQEL